jgi:hypothetical protein
MFSVPFLASELLIEKKPQEEQTKLDSSLNLPKNVNIYLFHIVNRGKLQTLLVWVMVHILLNIVLSWALIELFRIELIF